MSTKRNTLWEKWTINAMIAIVAIGFLALLGHVLYVEHKSWIPKVEAFNMKPYDMTTTNDRFDWSLVVTVHARVDRERLLQNYRHIITAKKPDGFNVDEYNNRYPEDIAIVYSNGNWLAIITNQLRNPFLDRWRGLKP